MDLSGDSTRALLTNTSFIGNYAKLDGGAVHASGARVHAVQGTLQGNRAMRGGALFGKNSKTTLQQCHLVQNFVENDRSNAELVVGGAAVYAQGGSLRIADRTAFRGNRASVLPPTDCVDDDSALRESCFEDHAAADARFHAGGCIGFLIMFCDNDEFKAICPTMCSSECSRWTTCKALAAAQQCKSRVPQSLSQPRKYFTPGV